MIQLEELKHLFKDEQAYQTFLNALQAHPVQPIFRGQKLIAVAREANDSDRIWYMIVDRFQKKYRPPRYIEEKTRVRRYRGLI